jgi:hypothetical protein
MPASVTLRTDYSAEELRRLAKSARTVGQGRRLLSLAAVLDGMSRADAACTGGMDRQRCPTGFTPPMKPAPMGFWTIGRRGPASRLSPAQKAELVAIVEVGPDRKIDGVVPPVSSKSKGRAPKGENQGAKNGPEVTL